MRLDKGNLEESRTASNPKGSLTGLTLTEVNQELLEIRQAKRRKNEEIEDFRSRTTSYQEFFSDLLALAFTKDGEAMYRGMNPAYAQKRSFLIDRNPDSWTETEEHLLLAPTGSFVWREYFSNPIYAGREAWILDNVFRAIETEIEWQLQTHPKIDPVEMNKRSIEAIRRRIK